MNEATAAATATVEEELTNQFLSQFFLIRFGASAAIETIGDLTFFPVGEIGERRRKPNLSTSNKSDVKRDRKSACACVQTSMSWERRRMNVRGPEN